MSIIKSPQKSTYLFNTISQAPEPIWDVLQLGIGPFSNTVVKNAKHKKVAPGMDLNFGVDICVPKVRFPKIYIFGAPIESEEPGLVFS